MLAPETAHCRKSIVDVNLLAWGILHQQLPTKRDHFQR